ncbi:vacuolar protein sorting-associated protein 35 [Fragilariopsis cylindrus CCMP1102]|uniref:Vacuolar protein sorting-associated protein 35 n=1 Tax=Fragilariopsis cylindrus CCMP1102 TaxID=635003 RepID=A0A1E7EP30_9STRA|nr:vacuolar protein sorting-associated protein 35 [Fragilariopsis cylindrus CCMP1102]|eukprot:OEU07691.1 vacuolar protein sorting-associated protein 35 [Fragilariopsis cylindrus CCMP1102]
MASPIGQQQQQQQQQQQPQFQQQQQQQQQPVGQQQQPPTTNNINNNSISYTMKELYDCVQYCPNVLSRLYLQICAASALIRSGEESVRYVFKDLIEAVKCVQNPVRGLFLRHYLLQAFRDKLPNIPIPIDQIGLPIRDGANQAQASHAGDDHRGEGTVKDSYEFVLSNFIEMNKLWVRIQHLPGDQRTKEVRRRREKDRNELRILVGTNLVRLSALDSITSTIYGQVILPTVLDQIVICADPLSQAYLIDCIVQVFPDEYHIETMPILLGVCPKLRDKVNIRTILISLMDRLVNYLADEELLDEKDSNQVKKSVALDSFNMFNECVQNVYNSRGPKLNAKEVIRLQTALLDFSMKCYKGNLEQITLCLRNCQQQQQQQHQALEPVATKELEKLLSIPLDELGLGALNLDYYSDLIVFLPWNNRREVALTMLKAVTNTTTSKKSAPDSVKGIEDLFSVIAPQQHHQFHNGAVAGGSIDRIQYQQDSALVSKFIGMLDNSDTDILFGMLDVARIHLSTGRNHASTAHVALVFASLKVARQEAPEEDKKPAAKEEIVSPKVEKSKKTPKTVSCRKVFVFIQQIIASFAQTNPERGIKLYLEAALTADKLGFSLPEGNDQLETFGSITFELFTQSFSLYEQHVMADTRIQRRCVTSMIGKLLACRSLGKKEYEGLIMKTSKFAAKMIKKSEQCEMVTRCAHLFYNVVIGGDDDNNVVYANPQRCLECLQRSLKLADSCTNVDPSNLRLFVDLLDSYCYFFEKKNSSITGNYITGLVALIKEQVNSAGGDGSAMCPPAVGEAKAQFLQIVRHIKDMKKKNDDTSEQFKDIDVSAIET